MRTSRDIYNQILWDPAFDKNLFIIGCKNRSGEIEDKAFIEFDPQSIPWSRVWYFKMREMILWDRGQRLDLFSDEGIRQQVMSMAQSTPTVKKDFCSLPIYTYQNNTWSQRKKQTLLPESKFPTWTIVTLNVLFDLYYGEEIYTPERTGAIFALLQNYHADLIALQEVTPSFLGQLLQQPWVQDYYITDSPKAETVSPYGQIILSRYPITKLSYYEYSPKKKVIVAQILMQEQTIAVAAVHLSSSQTKNPLQKRNEQLKILLPHISTKADHSIAASILLGDFNFSVPGEEEDLTKEGFCDAWDILYPNVPGHTFNPRHNELAKITSKSGEQHRYDRIYCQSGNLEVATQKLHLLGVHPYRDNQYYSDHYGLWAKLCFYAKEFSPSYHSSLVIIPPKEVWPTIEKIRKQYDSQFKRWMPHINLVYGFLAPQHFALAAKKIKEAIRSFSPFIIHLEQFFSFSHHSSHTVWLQPTTQPPGILYELQATLEKLFPPCNEQSHKAEARYTPHISVAQFKKQQQCLEHLDKWQRDWHTLSFEVKELYIISRQKNTPFAIRKSIALNANKNYVASALGQYSNQQKYTLEKTQQQQRLAAFKRVQKAYIQCLKNNKIDFVNEGCYLVGSRSLQIDSPEGDIDIMCIGPHSLLRQQFFQQMKSLLRQENKITQVRIIAKAVVPILQLTLNNVSIDILYARFPENLPLCHPHYIAEVQLQKFAEVDQLALLSYLELRAIRDSVKEKMGLFQTILPIIKKWAKVRQLDANGFGYPGGYSWTLLGAWICIRATCMDPPETLLQLFFKELANWNWKKAITITPESQCYQYQENDKMTVVTPLFPYKNSTRNVLNSTLKVICTELKRANNVLKEKNAWDKLLVPIELEYSQYLVLQLKTKGQIEDCMGWVHGHILSLLLALEKLSNFIRPYSKFYQEKSQDNAAVILIGLEKKDVQLDAIVNNFIKQFHSWKEMPKKSKLNISILSLDELFRLISF